MVRFSSAVGSIFIILYIFKGVEAVNVNAVIISLPNEYCRVRPTLINVGQAVSRRLLPNDYYVI